MEEPFVRLTRRRWASIPDPGPMQPELWRWVSSEDLEAAMTLLEPHVAEMIRLSWQGRLRFEEIAQRLNVSITTVGVRLFRGRLRLRQILRDRLPPHVRDQLPVRRA